MAEDAEEILEWGSLVDQRGSRCPSAGFVKVETPWTLSEEGKAGALGEQAAPVSGLVGVQWAFSGSRLRAKQGWLYPLDQKMVRFQQSNAGRAVL